jgi:hypothetical protein
VAVELYDAPDWSAHESVYTDWLVMVTVLVPDSSVESVCIAPFTGPLSVHETIALVFHDTVPVLPLRTREGCAVMLCISPFGTHVEPPDTCTWPAGHVQLGEYAWLSPLVHTGRTTQYETPPG